MCFIFFVGDAMPLFIRLNYFKLLPTRDKQFVIIPGLAHVTFLGLNRARFWHVMKTFLLSPERVDIQ